MIRKLTIILAVGCLLSSMAMGDVWQDLAKYNYGDKNNVAGEALTLLQNTPVAQHAAIETKLIALISSKDATEAGKSFACRMLQQIGTEKCVPAAAALLGDKVLSHYARLVLEVSESPKASTALLTALPKVSEKLKCGIIMTLGNRKEKTAVKAIAASLGSKDPGTAAASMRSLAMIGGKDASECLAGVKTIAALDAVLKESQIVCSESLKKADAAKICSAIYSDAGNSPPVRIAALRGLLKANGKTAAPIVVKLLAGKSGYMKQGAMRIVASDQCKNLTGEVASALASMPAPCQLKVLDVLGQRGDITALKGVEALYGSSSADVKLTAYKTAGRIGDSGCIKPLLVLANDKNPAIARKAVSILGIIDNKDIHSTLAASLGDPKLGPGAINVLTRRGCTSVTNEIVKLIESGNVETKVAAWTAMSNLATDKNLDSLMKQIVKISNDKVRAAAINAIKNICTNSGDRRKCFSSIAPYYAKADKNLKTLILNIGATTGGVKALDTAKTALASSDAEIRIAAIRALMAWRDSGAADTLLDIAQNGKTDKDKILALRGYIQVTGKENTRTRVKMYMKAAKLAKSSGAKNMIISGLRRLNQFDALQALTTWFDDESVKATAEQAAIGVVTRINRNRRLKSVIAKNKEEILAILKGIKDTSKNEKNAAQAAKLYKELGGK